MAVVDDILITSELVRRPARAPDFESENQALVALATVMAESPKGVLQQLAETALKLCKAGSAGISVLESDTEESVFRWRATAGCYAAYVGTTTPRTFSPCGTVLDRNAPQLMVDLVRVFPYVEELCPPVHEVLLVPFHQDGKAVGTVWVVSHSAETQFDAEDLRLVTSLTRFAGAAIQTLTRFEQAEAAERSLRESEERFRALVTASSDAVCRMSADFRVMRQLVGREFIADTREPTVSWLETYVPPEDHALIRQTIEEALRHKRGFQIEHRVVRTDGSIGWSYSRAIPVLDEQGIVVEWFGAASDVTERKQAESGTTRLVEKLALALDAGNLGTWEWDPATDNMVLSAKAGEIYGVEPGVPHNREQLRSLLHEEDRDLARQTAAQAMADRVDYEIEYRVLRPGGAPMWVAARGRGVYDADGRLLRMHGVVQDITARRGFEDGLRKQSERLRLLWEAAAVLLTTEEPDAMMRGLFKKIAPHFGLDTYFNFMVHDSGTYLRLESCLGIPQEVANTIQRLEFGQAICGTVAVKKRAMTATRIQDSEDPRVQLVKGFGIRAYTCNPLLAGDRLLGTLSFASRTRDTFEPDEVEFLRTICHYVTVAYERLRLIQELREADRQKDDFIALLAHELRNPLAPIRNGLQVLRLADGDAEQLSWARDVMDRQLAHMVRLIDDLLDISRINRNKMELRRARISLKEVVTSAVETARPLLDAARHELTVALPATPVALDADLTRMAQVFANLLTNSAKYTPTGGRVWLSAERVNSHVEVMVRDTGIGIPAHALPTIFDMFSQVDRGLERRAGGLGIGLALVKGLVEMHGGTVSATSDGEGRGATFTIMLPEAERLEPSRPARAESQIGGPSHRILVVDDNKDGAESLATLLRILGHEIQTAHDGSEAVAAAAAFRPDVILMDVGMPVLNGLDATRRIREQPWGKEVTIIALTGWGQENDRERSRSAGCDGHLVKPVPLKDLQAMLMTRRGRADSG